MHENIKGKTSAFLSETRTASSARARLTAATAPTTSECGSYRGVPAATPSPAVTQQASTTTTCGCPRSAPVDVVEMLAVPQHDILMMT